MTNHVDNPAIWDQAGEFEPFVGDQLNMPLVDAIYIQYLSGLGNFPFLGGETIPKYNPVIQFEIWTLLFFATLFVSLLFINTLVTVIGAKYE